MNQSERHALAFTPTNQGFLLVYSYPVKAVKNNPIADS